MADGMKFAPRAKARRVVGPGEFKFGVIGLDHGHIVGMTHSLIDAGGELVAVYDPNATNLEDFMQEFGAEAPSLEALRTEDELLQRADIQMVASAAVPADRGPLGLRVMDHEKNYFSDKTPFTTLEQLADAKKKVEQTGLIWAVCYSERVQNESAVHAGRLIHEGAIGTILQVVGFGPHRLNASSRPEWFYKRERVGGILTDIGSHQVEQFLFYAGARDARILHSKVANYNHPQYPEFDDFGDATLVADNGATNYFRVDWFTPDGLGTWGDGRTFILGTDGYIELRKYINVATGPVGDQVFLVDHDGEQHINVHGEVGFPYFGELILDCLDGTDVAMTQDHTFKAAELCLLAEREAVRIDVSPVGQ
jgi:predicted dehydrogenase